MSDGVAGEAAVGLSHPSSPVSSSSEAIRKQGTAVGRPIFRDRSRLAGAPEIEPRDRTKTPDGIMEPPASMSDGAGEREAAATSASDPPPKAPNSGANAVRGGT